jgi:hypothetical protein
LIKRRPELLYLLRKSSVSPPTYPRLAKLFKPTFREPGTNGRILEEKSYRYFLKYMKEVAGMYEWILSLSYDIQVIWFPSLI